MRVDSFANHRKRGDAAHSKRWREVPRSLGLPKGLDCGAFRRFAPPGFNHAQFPPHSVVTMDLVAFFRHYSFTLRHYSNQWYNKLAFGCDSSLMAALSRPTFRPAVRWVYTKRFLQREID
jgi:hypothetical protein